MDTRQRLRSDLKDEALTIYNRDLKKVHWSNVPQLPRTIEDIVDHTIERVEREMHRL